MRRSMAEKANQKVKKAKGPIRFEAIVPLAIVVGLIVLYVTLFFDGHLRRGIEWAATRVNGAEVNVGSLKTSFLGAWLRIGGVEVTNLQQPEKNKIEIGEIKFSYSWDAL